MKTLTTIEELARALAAVRGSVRMGYRRGAYVCAVEFVGGSATFANTDLPIALGAALCFLYNPRAVAPAIEPVHPDPDGARVGPAPTPDPTGTLVGVAAAPSHCASCGFGEEPEQTYDPQSACPSCGGMEPCTKPNGHDDGVHTVAE